MSKVCVIGLDGGTFRILDFLIARKRLPNFERIINEGSRATLLSSHPPLTPAAWASFYTGTNPGKHSAVDFFKRDTATYKLNPINANSVNGETLWSRASDYDKKVCIYNVPVTYPAAAVNGILISGMDAPSMNEQAIYPSGFRSELLRKFPGFQIEPRLEVKYLVNNYEDPIGEHIRRLDQYLEMQFDVMRFLMQRDDWDLFMAVIRSTDIFQHSYWRDVQAVIGEEQVSEGQKHGADVVFGCYEKIDRELGEQWMAAGSDRNMVIMSDHGFGSLYKEVCLNRVLAQGGLLKFKDRGVRRRARDFLLNDVVRKVSGRMNQKLRNRLFRFMNKDRIAKLMVEDTLIADIDWSGTKVYSVGQFGCLYVNFHGREPLGIVRGEKEREAVLAELQEVLSGLKDPVDGKPVVTEFHRGDELYHGSQASLMPDMVIVMRNYSYRGVYSTFSELSEDDIIRTPSSFMKELAPNGDHRREGMLLMHGPDITRADLGEVGIIDVAPTILNLLRLPAPDNYDGKVIKEAFATGSEFQFTAEKNKSESIVEERNEQVYSEEDEEEVRRRLQDLGYL